MFPRNQSIYCTIIVHSFNLFSFSSLFQVRAGESLMKLISEIKQYLILNDFPSVNEAIAHNSKVFLNLQETSDCKLTSLRDDLAIDLYELEEEYYSSQYK